MRTSLVLVLLTGSVHAAPDPCTAAKLGLAKVTQVAPRIVGPTCHIRSADGIIDKARLRKTFPSVEKPGDPSYGSSELTLAVSNAKELAAAVTCDGALPAIDFKTDRAWVIVSDHLRAGSSDISRGFDDGKTLVLAERTFAGCPGGAVYTYDRLLVTTIVLAPAGRAVERRTCSLPEPPCPRNVK
ncbi:MAG: hypothetical protein ABJE66_01095 [Deltaproteobacteria bacterium]